MGGSNLFVGTLDLLILHCVQNEPRHGYAVGRKIRERSAGSLAIDEGALYPALHRLEKRGLVRSDWGKTDTGRKAKFYCLTSAGRAFLEAERERWSQHSSAVDAVIGTP